MRWLNAYSITWRKNLTMSAEFNTWQEAKDIIAKYNKSERIKGRICDWEIKYE